MRDTQHRAGSVVNRRAGLSCCALIVISANLRVTMILITGNHQERMIIKVVEVRVAAIGNLPYRGDLSAIIDIDSVPQLNPGRNQTVQVDHVAVLPQESVNGYPAQPRGAHDLTL